MPGDLREVQDTWERLAQIDPLWAVLSEPDKRGRKWCPDDFLATGRLEIEHLLEDLRSLGFDGRESALDFGCGAGRLSIALAAGFSQVVSVDISPTMVETARTFAGGASNIRFIVNDRDDLSVLAPGQFDLVYSNIVLQHMPPEAAAGYIREFYRVVRPGGFVVFQIPSHLTEEWLPGGGGSVLPEEARAARVVVLDAPATLVAGQKTVVRLQVTNQSGVDWMQDLVHQINVDNHWVGADGVEILHDDARSRLPGSVRAGETCEVSIEICAPRVTGCAWVEFDVVQEAVCWFADHGSIPARHPIAITAPISEEDVVESAPSAYPTFMMNGIPRDEVRDLVAACGAEVLDEAEHITEWVSYRYTTRLKD